MDNDLHDAGVSGLLEQPGNRGTRNADSVCNAGLVHVLFVVQAGNLGKQFAALAHRLELDRLLRRATPQVNADRRQGRNPSWPSAIPSARCGAQQPPRRHTGEHSFPCTARMFKQNYSTRKSHCQQLSREMCASATQKEQRLKGSDRRCSLPFSALCKT